MLYADRLKRCKGAEKKFDLISNNSDRRKYNPNQNYHGKDCSVKYIRNKYLYLKST